ncbi:MAG TPA: gamma-glutamyltransferase [Rhizomicrobium sp.]|jgi:gamma-glutamyltranspeptidase/glutathione hydrolase|nr:gamma-glutamyltransferase [Rhizomicrobium sp.]
MRFFNTSLTLGCARLVCAVALIATALPANAQVTETAAKHHMIAAANPHAAEAGLEMMRAGGTAVDAAIATQMVLGLVEPESSGIGGGAFMLVYNPKTKHTTSFDGREMAPASATPTMFLDANGQPRNKGEAIPGGLSVGIPGVVKMLWMAHGEYGKLPWAKLFQPAIKLAENGFPVGPKLARTIQNFTRGADMPDIRAHFYHPDGTPLREGEIYKDPEYAATLKKIAKEGPNGFYKGSIAQAIVDAVHHAPKNQGGMTLTDLANYQPKEREPVCGDYREYRVCSMGPPSSGGIAVLQILEMLQRFSPGQLTPNTPSGAHLFAEASRLAYADRAQYLGDPAFVDVPVKGLLDKSYIASRAALIDPTKDMGTAVAGNPPQKHAELSPQVSPVLHGTSHMTIVDDSGEVVAMTTSVESVFGANVMVKGFMLNNTLTDFSFQPVRDGKPVANAPAPGKLPLSAMSPTIVFDKNNNFLVSVGSPGGPAIIDYVAQILIGILDAHMSPRDALAMPHEVNMNGATLLEQSPTSAALAFQLTAMGHNVQVPQVEGSGLHGIEKTKDGYIGAADPRRDGIALGD